MLKTTANAMTDLWTPQILRDDKICGLSFHGLRGDNDDGATMFAAVEKGLELPIPYFSPQLPVGVYDWGKMYIKSAFSLIRDYGYEYVKITGVSLGGMACLRAMHWNETETNWPKLQIISVGVVCGKDDKYNYPAYAKHKLKFWHGKNDTTCRYSSIVTCVSKIQSAGGSPETDFRDGIGHNAWSFAYNPSEQGNYFEWAFQDEPKAGLYIDGVWAHESKVVVCDKTIEYRAV